MNPTEAQLDTLKEIINVGIGRAAAILNDMLSARVYLDVPEVRLWSIAELTEQIRSTGDDRLAVVSLDFRGPFTGTAHLVFPTESAIKLATILAGDDPEGQEMDSLIIGTITEVGNILINGVMGSIGNILNLRFLYSIPSYEENTLDRIMLTDGAVQDITVLLVRTRFTIKSLSIDGDMLLIYNVGSFSELLAAIDRLSPTAESGK
jgi:chemotaxis protein CheC